MAFFDRYPEHLDMVGDLSQAPPVDEVVYRLVASRMGVPGLPDQVTAGAATVFFTRGPIRTQITLSRQRPGFPFTFDKVMRRGVPVGEGQLLTVAEIRIPPHEDLGQLMTETREEAEAALGLLCAMLDERLVREYLTEDLLLMAGGAAVAAVDHHARVRTFLPFDVNAEDLSALGKLRDVELRAESSPARAASLYLAGAREGPTRRGFLLLWLAIDALIETRKTQKNSVSLALAAAGFDQDWLRLSLGRLVGLRGNVAHGRLDDPGLLRFGFYDSEAIARALIRHAASLKGGWPVMPDSTAFALPTANRIADAQRNWTEEWHDDDLPPASDPDEPTGLPRYDAARGEHDQWLRVVGTEDDEVRARLRFWTLDAIRALDVEEVALEIEVIEDDQLPARFEMAVNRERIRVSRSLASPESDDAETRLAFHVCSAVAQSLVMSRGVTSQTFGAFLIELGGAWASYREWVSTKDLPADALQLQSIYDLPLDAAGAIVGAALAGDDRAARDVAEWLADQAVDQDVRHVVAETMRELRDVDHFRAVLGFMTRLVETERALRDELDA